MTAKIETVYTARCDDCGWDSGDYGWHVSDLEEMVNRHNARRHPPNEGEHIAPDRVPDETPKADHLNRLGSLSDSLNAKQALLMVAEMHSPNGDGECRTCFDGMGFHADYPCATATLIAETVGLVGTEFNMGVLSDLSLLVDTVVAVADLCDVAEDLGTVTTAEMRGYRNALLDIRSILGALDSD